MKNLILIILIVSCSSLFSQNDNGVKTNTFNYYSFRNVDKENAHILEYHYNSVSTIEASNRKDSNLSYSTSVLTHSLKSPSVNYMALYNKSSQNYKYYKSNSRINFNMSSINCRNHKHLNKTDSFNPYNSNDVGTGIALGLVNTILNSIQK